jgi:hypothetical protein
VKNVRIKSNLEILGFTVFKGAIRGFVQIQVNKWGMMIYHFWDNLKNIRL